MQSFLACCENLSKHAVIPSSTSLAKNAHLLSFQDTNAFPAVSASDLPFPRQTTKLSCCADAGDAAEALAALQGSSRGMAPSQAPGAPPMTAQILPGLRVPGMGRGSSLYRGVSKVSLSSWSCICLLAASAAEI